MVDVKTSNIKLIERAKTILMKTTNIDYEKASEYLKKSGNSVKVAIAMVLLNIEKEEAEEKLKLFKYNVARMICEFTNKAEGK